MTRVALTTVRSELMVNSCRSSVEDLSDSAGDTVGSWAGLEVLVEHGAPDVGCGYTPSDTRNIDGELILNLHSVAILSKTEK